MCRKHGHSLALTVLLVVAAQAWQYDPDFMANQNMQLQPPMLPNFGMDPLGVFTSPIPMNAPPMVPPLNDATIDFDPQMMPQPLQSNELGVPRFAQQQPEVSTVVVQRRAGGFVARPGEEMVPQTECREGEPGCGPPQVIETATTTTATPIDEDKDKEKREEWERERRERKEREEKRKREKQEEEDKKKKEKEEREEKRRKEREEKEEQEKKEREEREERHRREREEKEERDKERREKRREEDERDRKSFEDDDDEKDGGKHKKRKHHKDDDDDDKDDDKDKKKKKGKCSKCSKCQKKKDDDSSSSSSGGGQKDEGTIEHDGKTIHVVVSTKDEKGDKDKDEDGDCDKKSEDGGDCGCNGGDDEEKLEKEDPLVTEKKKEYEKLTQMIKKDEEEFSKEADWLTKALSLVAELKQKTHNVQMHLNDLHKDMSLMEHKRQHAAAELEEAEKKKGEEEGLRKMEKELDLLMSASNAANEKINMLSSRKAQYMAKIGEVRNMLQEIKLRHMAANPSAFQSMAESFRSAPPPSGGEQQEDDKMEVVPQFRF